MKENNTQENILHRNIENKKLKTVDYEIKFIKPGMKQQSGLVKFIVEICKELVFSKKELNETNNTEITNKCINKFLNSGEEIKEHIGMSMLSNPETFDVLYEVFKDCFPEIVRPQDLKDEVFSELLEIVMESIVL